MPQVVSHWPLTAEAWIQSQVTACGIFSEQTDTGTRLFPSTLVFPCIIPPMLYTHLHLNTTIFTTVAYLGGGPPFNPPPPEIPKALQNCAKLNPIVKTDKNC